MAMLSGVPIQHCRDSLLSPSSGTNVMNDASTCCIYTHNIISKLTTPAWHELLEKHWTESGSPHVTPFSPGAGQSNFRTPFM